MAIYPLRERPWREKVTIYQTHPPISTIRRPLATVQGVQGTQISAGTSLGASNGATAPQGTPTTAGLPTKTPLKQRKRAMHFVRADQIEELELRFLWNPYIPMGTTTMIFGHGGLGKSYISCAIAADVSAGRALPGQAAMPPQKVLMLSAEDDPGYLIKPRLRKLGANMENVYVSDDSFALNPEAVADMEEYLKEYAATIVFIDPLVTYIGGKVDMNKANEARASIGPLMEAAKRTGTAMVIVHHQRKDDGGRAGGKALGSADFVNSARSVLHVEEDKIGARVMRHTKHNWSAPGRELWFDVQDDTFKWIPEPLAVARAKISTTPALLGKAISLLRELLAEGAAYPVTEIETLADLNGITKGTLTRAKAEIGIKSIRVDGAWRWILPIVETPDA